MPRINPALSDVARSAASPARSTSARLPQLEKKLRGGSFQRVDGSECSPGRRLALP